LVWFTPTEISLFKQKCTQTAETKVEGVEDQSLPTSVESKGEQGLTTTQVTSEASQAPVAPPPEMPKGPRDFSGFAEELQREYRVLTTTWSDADPIDTKKFEIRFPDVLFAAALPIIRARLSYWRFYRCNVKVRVVVTAPPTYGGALWFTPCPFHDSYYVGAASRVVSRGQRCQTPGGFVMSASGGGTHEFGMPWRAPVAFGNVPFTGVIPSSPPGERGVVGTLYCHVLAPLEMPSAASETVNISVFAALSDVELAGPTSVAQLPLPLVRAVAQSKTPKKEAEKRSEKGVISSIAKAAGEVAGMFSMVPGLEPLALVGSGAKMVAPILENLGLDQPVSTIAPTPMRWAGMPMHTHGLASVDRASDVPDSRMSPIDSLYPGIEKNPSFLDIAKKPGYLMNWTFDSSTAIDTRLAYWFCHPLSAPTHVIGADTYKDPPPLAAVSAGFSLWKGPIRYKIQFFAPAMTTYAVRIVYFPDANVPVAAVEGVAGDLFTKYVQATGDCEVDFEVPYHFLAAWRTCCVRADRSAGPMWSSAAIDGGGSVAVYLVTAVRSYDAAATFVTAVLWTAAGEGYQLADPLPGKGAIWAGSKYGVAESRDEPISATPQSKISRDLTEAFKDRFPAMADTVSFIDKNILSQELPTSPHEEARRPQLIYTQSPATSVVGVGAVPRWSISEYVSDGRVSTDKISWRDWILSSFRGFRGSLRLYLRIAGTSAVSVATAGEIGPFHVTKKYSTDFHSAMGNVYGVELPPSEPNYYIQPFLANVVVSAEQRLQSDDWLVRGTATLSGGSVMTYQAAGDDLQLYDWVAPLLVI
jgi:hypothetical protein